MIRPLLNYMGLSMSDLTFTLTLATTLSTLAITGPTFANDHSVSGESDDKRLIFSVPKVWPSPSWKVDLNGGSGLIENFNEEVGVIDLVSKETNYTGLVEKQWLRNVLYIQNLLSTDNPLTIRVHGIDVAETSNLRHGVGVAMFTNDIDGKRRKVNLELSKGSSAFLFNQQLDFSEDFSEEGDQLTKLMLSSQGALNIANTILDEVNRPKTSFLYVTDGLYIQKDTFIAVGGTLAEAQKNGWNLYMGADSALIFDGLQKQEVDGIHVEDGASAYFEKGSVIVIMNPLTEFTAKNTTLTPDTFIEAGPNAKIEGLENCSTFVFKNEQVFEVSFTKVDGGWQMSEKIWKPTGYFAESINELFKELSAGTAPSSLQNYYKQWILLDDFAQHAATLNFMQKSLGTTTEMDRQTQRVIQTGVHAARRYETMLPLDVEILTSRSEGQAIGLNVLNELDGLKYERESNGIAVGLNGRYLNRFVGMRVAYDDADVRIDHQNFRKGDMIEGTSTILTTSFYAGQRYDWGYLTGHLSYAAANDKTRILGISEEVIGAEKIQRQSVSLGMMSTFVSEGEWVDTGFTAGGYMTYFLPVRYGMGINSQEVWKLEEEKRLVWTGHLGADVSGLWHPTSKSYIKLNFDTGLRLRIGDTEVKQTMTVGGVSSSVTTDDLARGEAYASLLLSGKLADGRFGAGVTQALGPDGVKHVSAEFHVTFDFD